MGEPRIVNGHGNGAEEYAKSVIATVDEFIQTSFDYLILGGGTAGCAIAARLSEDAHITVGVIEAGKCRIGDPIIDLPTGLPRTLENPEYDWCMYTTPQKNNKNKVHHMPRGKLLGGTSGINGTMYVRGSSQDYDDWAALARDEGWSSKVMNEYMRKHQTLEPIDPTLAANPNFLTVAEFHGTSGPIRTSFNEATMPFDDAIIKACEDVTGNAKKPKDPCSGDHIGFFHTLNTISRNGLDKGKRSYAARSYIEANKGRTNLKVLCDALVNKVNLDGDKATGANITIGGHQYDIPVKREVIVCGGAINSPQILELSGIGDPDVLKAAGVECLVENKAVGANFQDHVMTLVVQTVKPGISTGDTLSRVPGALEDALKQYNETSGGPLSRGASVAGFLPFKQIASDEELHFVLESIKDIQPTSEFHRQQLERIVAQLKSDTSANIQLACLPVSFNCETGVEHQSQAFLPPPPNEPSAFTLLVCMQYPVARGYVHINSPDASKQPIIEPNYAGHVADTAVLQAALRWLDKVTKNKFLADFVGKRKFPAPSMNLQEPETAREVLKELVMGEWHPCGSVALGDALDSRLRVKGVSNIRVADASIFPTNVSGNIASSVYAVAEKAADLVKEDWDVTGL